jgi:hypothetical protein
MSSGPSVRLSGTQHGDDSRIIFRGPPNALKTEFWIQNDGNERVRVGRASLRTRRTQERTEEVLDVHARIPLPARLRPGERRLLTPQISIDPCTPPGRYEGTVEMVGPEDDIQRVPVDILVTAIDRLEVVPDEFLFNAAAGATVKGELILTNHGNVAVAVGDLGRFVLEDEALLCRISRRALRAVDPAPKQVEDYLRHIVETSRDVLAELGFVRIRNPDLLINPGEVAVLPFELTLPKTLPGSGHYLAYARVHNQRFSIEIVTPTRAELDDEKGPARQSKPKAERRNQP